MRNKYSSLHPACRPSYSKHKDPTSMAARSEAANHVRSKGGTPQSATEALVSGNVHATENAKAVGNIT